MHAVRALHRPGHFPGGQQQRHASHHPGHQGTDSASDGEGAHPVVCEHEQRGDVYRRLQVQVPGARE